MVCSACQRGWHNLVPDCYLEPENTHRLCEALCDLYCGYIGRSVRELRPDGFWTSDDLGHQKQLFGRPIVSFWHNHRICTYDITGEAKMTTQPMSFDLELRAQELVQDAGGHNVWQVKLTDVAWAPAETAIVICDMWDDHWSRGAAERVVQMIPRMNAVLRAARAAGIQVVHAPSETMDF